MKEATIKLYYDTYHKENFPTDIYTYDKFKTVVMKEYEESKGDFSTRSILINAMNTFFV